MRPWSVLLVCAFLLRTAAAGGGGYSGKDGKGDGECIDSVPIPAWAERAAEPYASWQPCDTVATYTEVCDPQPPTCHVEYECEIAQVRQGDSRFSSERTTKWLGEMSLAYNPIHFVFG